MTVKELSRRFDKLEAAWNLGLKMLDKKSVTLLANAKLPQPLRKLVHDHMHGTIDSRDVPRLCKMLRVNESDLQLDPALRMAISLLLICIELRHSVRPRSKSPAETQLERG